MTIVMPTHTCFDDALEIIEALVRVDPRLARGADLVLVHAICVSPTGEEYAHAWAENNGVALFAGVIDGERTWLAADAREYAADARMKESTRYTPRQAWEENKRSGTFGPWIDRYLALCGGGRVFMPEPSR